MMTVPDRSDRPAVLRSLELLDMLDDDVLAAVEDHVEWLEAPAGEDVFREGDPSDAVYFVASGRLAIVKRGNADELCVVREIGAGQPVGELGLLLEQPRSATVTALRDSVLVRLDRTGFDDLISRHPAALLPLTRRIAERLVVTSRRPQRGIVPAVWLVVAVSPTVRLSALWSDLAPLVTACGGRCLTAADLGRACGGSELPNSTRAARWLEREARVGAPIFVLAEDAATIAMLAPNVDRALVIADAAHDGGTSEEHLEALRARGVPAPLDLVLCHASDRSSAHTDAWVARVRSTRHHHLRRADRRDLERLARVLTGRAVALALGGGGARAFVHIGAIRAIQEAEIPIDFVVGTNLGAVIGAQLALGWDPDRMVEENRRGWPAVGRDVILPFVSLLGGRSLRNLLQRMFGDTTIESLWRDFRCATIDLSGGRLVGQRTGPLARWVRASVSVPGVHPPVVHEGRLYVDGGLVRNVPLDLVCETGAGTVIAVDPAPFRRQTIDERVEEPPTGLDFLLQFLPIVGTGFPGVVSLIDRALAVGRRIGDEEGSIQADLSIEPPVDCFGITDYGQIEAIVEFGYEETKRRLEGDGERLHF